MVFWGEGLVGGWMGSILMRKMFWHTLVMNWGGDMLLQGRILVVLVYSNDHEGEVLTLSMQFLVCDDG